MHYFVLAVGQVFGDIEMNKAGLGRAAVTKPNHSGREQLGFLLSIAACPAQMGKELCALSLLRDPGSRGSTLSNVDCWVEDTKKALEGLPLGVIVHWPELATCPTLLEGLGSVTLHCTWKKGSRSIWEQP